MLFRSRHYENYKITVTNGGTTLDLYNFHNAFSTNGGSYVCLNVLGTQADNPHTVVAGDFNLDSENMNGLFTTFNDANNHYDHILTSSDITYVSSIVLDSDANGQPMQFVGGGSVTGSDHCPLFGSYQI